MSRSILITLVLCLGVLGGVLLLLRVNGSGAPPVSAGTVSTVDAEPGDSARKEPRELPTPVVENTGLTFLQQYWGNRWSAIEAKLREEEMWRDADFSKLPPPIPLEEALPKLREQVAGPLAPDRREGVRQMYMGGSTPADHEWIAREFARGKELGDQDFRAIEDLTDEVNRELEYRVELLIRSIEIARERIWNSGAYRLAPYALSTAQPARLEEGRMVSSEAGGWEGWTVGFKVLESDIPGFDDMHKEIDTLRARRDAAIVAYIRKL